MAKDPAVLLYIDKWNSTSSGLKSEFRAWYMDLLLYQHNNSSIPSDEDTLAGICHVLPSEYAKFKEFITQILTQKFRKCEESATYSNDVMSEILKKRGDFKDKKTKSAHIGNIIKSIRKLADTTEEDVKKSIEVLMSLDIENIKNIQNIANIAHLRTHLRTLYIDVDVIEDINKNIDLEKESPREKTFNFKNSLIEFGAEKKLAEEFIKLRRKKSAVNSEIALKKFLNEVQKSGKTVNEVITICLEKSWKGFEADWIIEKINQAPKINSQHDFAMNISGQEATFLARCEGYRYNNKKEPPQEWYDKFNEEHRTNLQPNKEPVLV